MSPVRITERILGMPDVAPVEEPVHTPTPKRTPAKNDAAAQPVETNEEQP